MIKFLFFSFKKKKKKKKQQAFYPYSISHKGLYGLYRVWNRSRMESYYSIDIEYRANHVILILFLPFLKSYYSTTSIQPCALYHRRNIHSHAQIYTSWSHQVISDEQSIEITSSSWMKLWWLNKSFERSVATRNMIRRSLDSTSQTELIIISECQSFS
jgi:hypothetical protein